MGKLSRAELQELALLYRQVAADLSVLRQDSTSRTLAAHVNELLARAHHIIYSGRRTNLLTVFRYLRDEYPVVFQRNVGYVAASLLIGTLFYLYVNGTMLGVIGAACYHYGMSLALWCFVAAHGSLELPSIIIAGAAGLRLGHGMLFPGGYRCKDSVAKGGVEATRLVSGIIPLLVIAGCLEGFLSRSQAPEWVKFTVGGLLFTLLNLWLFRPTIHRRA